MNSSGIMGFVKNHEAVIIIILCIIAAIASYKIIKKYYGKSKTVKGKIDKIKGFFRHNILVTELKLFKRNLPYRIKLALNNRKHFLYLNSADDALISSTAAFANYAYEYFPQYNAEKNYNFYMIKNIFVSEMKSEMIENNEPEFNKDCLKFWEKTYYGQKPTVLVSVNHMFLQKSAEEQTEKILSIRKKLNVLSKAINSQPSVYLCVSGIDSFKGAETFKEFHEQLGISHIVNISTGDNIETIISEKFNNYNDSINRLILNNNDTLNISDAIKYLSYLKELASKINLFSQRITFNDGILKPIKLKGLLFDNYKKGIGPFDELYSKPLISYKLRNTVISVIAVILIASIIKISIDIHSQVNNMINQVELNTNYLKNNTLSPADKYNIAQNSISIANGTYLNTYGRLITFLYPRDIICSTLNNAISDEIYDYILAPDLKNSTDAQQTLFYIFLIASDYNRSLRSFVEHNIDKFSSELSINQNIISFYTDYNSKRRKISFTGAPVYGSSNAALSNAVTLNYIIEMYNNLDNNSNITINDVQNFINFYESYLNKNVVSVELISKYYPLIQKALPDTASAFINEYSKYIKANKPASLPDIKDIQLPYVNLQVPSSATITSFSDLVTQINSMIDESNADSNVKLFSMLNSDGKIQTKNWSDIILTAKINTLLNEYYSNAESKTLFSQSEQNEFYPITLNFNNSGNFIFTGNYSIPGIYTKLAVDSFMQKEIQQYNTLLNTLQKLGINTQILSSNYNNALDNYVAAYKENYINLINSFGYSVESPVQLKYFLSSVSSSDSPLMQLISLINENTSFEKNDQTVMAPIINEFKAFQNLQKESTVKNNISLNSIEGYNKILGQLSSEMTTTVGNSALPASGSPLILSQIGEIAMNISLDNNDSYLKLVNMWLDSINMPSELREPFINPIMQVYKFGSSNLSESISAVWNQKMLIMITQFSAEFPFARTSTANIDPVQLSADFSPSGAFWQEFNTYFAPFMTLNNGKWSLKESLGKNVIISDSMIEQINKIQNLTSTLWDKQSNPQPISLEVLAGSLPEQNSDSSAPMVDMISLNAGNSKVIGINASQNYETLKLNWWEPSISVVNIQMTDGSSYNTPENQQTLSFFHLLNSASANGNSYTWKLNTLNQTIGTVDVSFNIKSDPWSLFAI